MDYINSLGPNLKLPPSNCGSVLRLVMSHADYRFVGHRGKALCYITVGGNTFVFWVDYRVLLDCETRLRGYRDSSFLWCHVTRGKARADLSNFRPSVLPLHVDCVREQGAVGFPGGVTAANNWSLGRVICAINMSVGTEDPYLYM